MQGRARLPSPRTPCPSPCAPAVVILPSGLAGTAFQGEFPMSWGTHCHPEPPLPLQEREGGAGSCPHPLACTSPGDPGSRKGGKAACLCGQAQRTPSVPLRRAHTAHHSVEEQLICKREDVMDEGLLDIAGRFPCLSPEEL